MDTKKYYRERIYLMHRQLNMSKHYLFVVERDTLDPYLRGEYEKAVEEFQREGRRLRRMVKKYRRLFGEYYGVI